MISERWKKLFSTEPCGRWMFLTIGINIGINLPVICGLMQEGPEFGALQIGGFACWIIALSKEQEAQHKRSREDKAAKEGGISN
ncbi:MAG TPA: hypothetical protein VL981_13165 [Candidatus Methylacidiphilales bacterium]|nr:hypothetical protein [Candidatus Methylacidiphilales bacterium]